MAIGRVSTQGAHRLRTVAHCRPEPFPAIVPPMKAVDELEAQRDQQSYTQ